MENQIKTVICPNCGANATNLQNCEYCGSILVQCSAAKARGVDVDIEQLKETLNACDSERIEIALRKICNLNYIESGFVHILYNNEVIAQLMYNREEGLMIYFVGDETSHNDRKRMKKVCEFVKKFGYEDDGEFVDSAQIEVYFGSDIHTASQVLYLIYDWAYGELTIDDVVYVCENGETGNVMSVLDANGSDMDRIANQRYIDTIKKQQIEQIEQIKQITANSNRGCFGMLAAIIGISIASLCALLLPIIF